MPTDAECFGYGSDCDRLSPISQTRWEGNTIVNGASLAIVAPIRAHELMPDSKASPQLLNRIAWGKSNHPDFSTSIFNVQIRIATGEPNF